MATKAKKRPTKKPKPRTNPVSAPMPEVLIPAEVAALLRVDEPTVVAEAIAGRLPGRCIAGQWRFLHAAIMAWLDSAHWPTLSDPPIPDETPEEQAAFLELLRSYRKASGKVGDAAESAA